MGVSLVMYLVRLLLAHRPRSRSRRHARAVRLGQPQKDVWRRDRRLQTPVHISGPTARSIAVE